MTNIYRAFFSELEKVATPSFRERQVGAHRKAGILDYEFSPQAQARYIDPYVKEGEIMPPPSDHIKRTAGSPVPRGPRMRAGGRVGTTTAHPFSGNKAKVAGIGPLVAGAALGAGGVGAYRTFKEPVKDFISYHNPEERLAKPITPSRTRYIALQNPLGPLLPRKDE